MWQRNNDFKYIATFSSLKMVKFEPTTPNMSQQEGKTNMMPPTMLRSFGRGLIKCFDIFFRHLLSLPLHGWVYFLG